MEGIKQKEHKINEASFLSDLIGQLYR